MMNTLDIRILRTYANRISEIGKILWNGHLIHITFIYTSFSNWTRLRKNDRII